MFFIPPGTYHCWVTWGSMEWEVCPTFLHMTSSGNWTPDILILSPTPYPLGHMLPLSARPLASINSWCCIVLQGRWHKYTLVPLDSTRQYHTIFALTSQWGANSGLHTRESVLFQCKFTLGYKLSYMQMENEKQFFSCFAGGSLKCLTTQHLWSFWILWKLTCIQIMPSYVI